eukprot:1175662-Prorocentrum_minimum.AAC.1
MRIVPIAQLNPYQNRWTIKARITSKGELRHWQNARGEGKVFSFDLIDEVCLALQICVFIAHSNVVSDIACLVARWWYSTHNRVPRCACASRNSPEERSQWSAPVCAALGLALSNLSGGCSCLCGVGPGVVKSLGRVRVFMVFLHGGAVQGGDPRDRLQRRGGEVSPHDPSGRGVHRFQGQPQAGAQGVQPAELRLRNQPGAQLGDRGVPRGHLQQEHPLPGLQGTPSARCDTIHTTIHATNAQHLRLTRGGELSPPARVRRGFRYVLDPRDDPKPFVRTYLPSDRFRIADPVVPESSRQKFRGSTECFTRRSVGLSALSSGGGGTAFASRTTKSTSLYH